MAVAQAAAAGEQAAPAAQAAAVAAAAAAPMLTILIRQADPVVTAGTVVTANQAVRVRLEVRADKAATAVAAEVLLE